MSYWTPPNDWKDGTAWIIGGGWSLRGVDLTPLQHRHTIAINSAIYAAPWADYLFFGDRRWYAKHARSLPPMRGVIVTNSPSVRQPEVKAMNRVKANDQGISLDRSTLAMLWTSMGAAMNLAVHLGAKRLVLLGADLNVAPDGRTHHHKPHPPEWAVNKNWVNMQLESLGYCVKPLHKLGIEVVNANPASSLPYWVKRPLTECLEMYP